MMRDLSLLVSFLVFCEVQATAQVGTPARNFRPVQITWDTNPIFALDSENKIWSSSDGLTWSASSTRTASQIIPGSETVFFAPDEDSPTTYYTYSLSDGWKQLKTDDGVSNLEYVRNDDTGKEFILGLWSSDKVGSKLRVSSSPFEDWTTLATGAFKAQFAGADLPHPETVYALVNSDSSTTQLISYDPRKGEQLEILQSDVYAFGCEGNYLWTKRNLPSDSTIQLRVARNMGSGWTSKGLREAYFQAPAIGIVDPLNVLPFDGSHDSLFVFVQYTPSTWSVFASDFEGFRFKEVVDTIHTYDSGDGFTALDFDFTAVDGVVYSNQQTSDGIITQRSGYNGYNWTGLWMPEVASGSSLHLFGDAAHAEFGYQPYRFLSEAPSVIIANGNEGTTLKPSSMSVCTYISMDAGENWHQVLGAPAVFAIANFGGVIAFAPSTSSTTTLSYTLDGTNVRQSPDLWTLPGTIDAIHADPTRPFFLIEYTTTIGPLTIGVTIDLGGTCSTHQIEYWIPESDHLCALGKIATYPRRLLDTVCLVNPLTHKARGPQVRCPCTLDDYECGFGYEPGMGGLCTKVFTVAGASDSCIGSEVTYNVSGSKRLLPGDQCDLENPDSKILFETASCTQSGGGHNDSTKTYLVWVLILLGTILCILSIILGVLLRKEDNRRRLCCVSRLPAPVADEPQNFNNNNNNEPHPPSHQRSRRTREQREQEREQRRLNRYEESARLLKSQEEEKIDPRFQVLRNFFSLAYDVGGVADEDFEMPESYTCAITQDIMCQPTLTNCGHTFEGAALRHWLRKKRVCPQCRNRVHRHSLRPNYALKHVILEWLDRVYEELSEKYPALMAEATEGVEKLGEGEKSDKADVELIDFAADDQDDLQSDSDYDDVQEDDSSVRLELHSSSSHSREYGSEDALLDV